MARLAPKIRRLGGSEDDSGNAALGRMAPEGLRYVSSWVETSYARCFQIMETEDPELFGQWIANWSDLIDFEVLPVVTSREAAESITPSL